MYKVDQSKDLLGTTVKVVASFKDKYNFELIDKAFLECERIEKSFSRFIDSGELYELNNNIVANAVDNWSDTHNVPMRDIDIKAEKEDTKQVFLKNIRPYTGGKSVTIVDSDSAESLSKIPVKSNVVLYDGEHTEEAHYSFLTKYNSKIDDTFCLIIDDWNWSQVRHGTIRSIEKLGYKVSFKDLYFN